MARETWSCGVAFHIDQTSTWNLLLANVKNLLDGWEGPVDVEVVANGPAVEGLVRESGEGLTIERLTQRGVRFLACNNSLRAHSIAREDLIPQIEVVASGVVHLAALQLDGWAYLKP